MNNYRVYGSKEIKYYIDVEAEDKLTAIELAEASGSHEWNQLSDDDIIEPFDVMDNEEFVDLSTNL